MKKSILIFTLLLCLLLCCLIPAAAFADEVHRHARESFHEAFTAPLPVSDETSYYLTGDFKAESDIVIDREIELCLNGFTIDMGSHSIRIAEKGTLTLYDCPESTSGGIRSSVASDEAIIVNEGILSICGGVLHGENRTVLFNRASASVWGGYFQGEDADLIKTIGSAVLSISGGEITAEGKASAVRMVADPADETAKKRDYNVGVGGGAIVTAQAESQGTLVVDAAKGRFVLNGGNTKGSGCPAVTVLSGNFDVYGAAAVYSDTESAIVGTGGKLSLYNAVITSDNKYGVDISQDASLLLSGALDINGGMAGVHLAEGKLFSMSDYGFYGNVVLSIHTDTDPSEGNSVAISTPCDAKHFPHFISSNPGCTITYENGAIYNTYDGSVSHFHDGRNYIMALDSGLNDLTKNNYFLQSDLTRYGFYTGNVVNLCLNGHTLKLNSAIQLYPGSTLNIFDCTGEGKIEANSNVIQDINGGSVKVVLHDGLVISHGSSVVKLSGDDSLIVNGGKLQSEFEGSCAVEVTGENNSVKVTGGEIVGAHSGIRTKDAELELSGSGSISGGSYAVDHSGYKQGLLSLDGSPALSGEAADIHLASNMLLTTGKNFAPAETVSIACDTAGDYVVLSASAEGAHGKYFEAADGERKVVSGVDNALLLVKPLAISPTSAQIKSGEEQSFTAEYTGASAQPQYQWYIRRLDSMKTSAAANGTHAQYSVDKDLSSGEYELFCVVSDESGQYITESAALTVIENAIENVQVSVAGEVICGAEAISPEIHGSASTRLGTPVRFSYSLDAVNYTDAVPAIGPAPGEYVIHYLVSSEGCDDVKGELKVTVSEAPVAEEELKPIKETKFDVDLRFIAIIALIGLELIVCVVYLIVKTRKPQ